MLPRKRARRVRFPASNQPVTSAGRHPDSDIFLDDVTVSRRHAEFRLESDEFHVVSSTTSP
ncbi:FHA domain-containing protein [Mycolicibacterium pulveris]|uniref:FHA domain-containing protein n=1 Tax=Mycolicibacterium pulveris TaxID=36813 RepID=UPI003908A26F